MKELDSVYNIYRNVPILSRYPSLHDIYEGMKEISNFKMQIVSEELFTPKFEGKIHHYFEEGLKEAKKRMKYDGTHWRLCRHYESKKEEVLEVQPVKYSVFLATNRNENIVNRSLDLLNPFVYKDLANSLGHQSF